MIKKCDGIIFDVDGTMWDSTEVCARGYNKAITRLLGEDYPHCNADMLKKLFGKTTAEIGAGLFPDRAPKEQYFFTVECIREAMKELEKNPPSVYPELVATLDMLYGKYDMFIVSNCEAGYIELLTESAGIEKYFRDHLCLADTGLDKQGNISEIIRRYDLKDAVYVGDVQGDADSAHAAGIRIIYAAYGFGTVKDPDETIHSLKELPGVFGIAG